MPTAARLLLDSLCGGIAVVGVLYCFLISFPLFVVLGAMFDKRERERRAGTVGMRT